MNVPAAHPALYRALSWGVCFLVPLALVLTAGRIILGQWFLPFEYARPGFPADYYGFTLQDRLHWGRFAIDYLTNDAGIEYLGDLRFANGRPVYNERELHHMVDVKVAVTMALRIWLAALAGLVGLGLWAWKGGWWALYRLGLQRGGFLTMLLIGAILLFVALAFRIFFVQFHNVFFQPGTWMFEWSDTLIRLFPERFWRDIFVYIGALSGLGGFLLWVLNGGKPY